jgi:hypothetical protein
LNRLRLEHPLSTAVVPEVGKTAAVDYEKLRHRRQSFSTIAVVQR